MNVVPEIDVLPERPYPGLRAFRQDEWTIYFGREDHANEVIRRVGRHGLVLLHGASGCGKSSLIRAGVLPSLEIDHEIGGRMWRTATIRPSEGLLMRLAEVLEHTLPRPQPEPAEEDTETNSPVPPGWADLVVKGGGLVGYVEDALRAAGGGSLCLLVDQFEEIFRWAKEKSDAEARLFIEFLKNVRAPESGSGFFVILTMRSDYLGSCATYDGFAEFLNERQYLLPKMDEFGLLRAIHEPAELYGGSIEPAVATLLLPVVIQQLDGLPVLQHALMRASDHARKRYAPDEPWVVTSDDLEAIGGAERALSQHADEVFAAATRGDSRLEEAVEWIFRALTDLDADRRAIRRPCRFKELAPVSGVSRDNALKVLEPFRAPDCVFISPYQPAALDDDTEIDISHEALIRQWPRLCSTGIGGQAPPGWVYREFYDGMVWRSLVFQAEKFAGDRRQLLSVATTEQRLPWFKSIKKHPGWTRRHVMGDLRLEADIFDKQWDNVEQLMEASAKNAASEHTLIGRLRTARNFSLISMCIALIAFGISFYFYWEAEKSRDEIEAKNISLNKLKEQSDRLAVIGTQLIESICINSSGNDKNQLDLCKKSLLQQFRGSVAFKVGEETPSSTQIKGEGRPLPPGQTHQR